MRAPRVAGPVLALALTALVVNAAGCGGSSESSSEPATTKATTTTAAPPTTAPPATAVTAPPTALPATTTPPATFGAGNTPEAAIAAYEVARTPSRQFAGPCADTELPRDVGKWCSALISDPTDSRTYSVGPAFSESEERLTLVRNGAIWSVTAREPSPRPGG